MSRSRQLKTILITGASRGIGHELARLAARKGHDVVLVARSAGAIEDLASELAEHHGVVATAIPVDLAAPDAVDVLASELEERGITVDALVNNAALGLSGPFHDQPDARLRQLLELNVVTLASLTRRLLPPMVERRNGAVLNIASVAAFTPGPQVALYHASKSFVLSFSLAVRRELRGTGVSITCLCPGPVDTGFPADAGQGNVTRAQKLTELSPERVAAAGYRAMVRRRAVVVPGASMRVTTQLTRHLPLRVVTAMAGRALHGTLDETPRPATRR